MDHKSELDLLIAKTNEVSALAQGLRLEQRQLLPVDAFGNLVAEQRKARDISQEDLASLAGISVGTLHKIESGKGNPTLKVMQSLARALGIKLWLEK